MIKLFRSRLSTPVLYITEEDEHKTIVAVAGEDFDANELQVAHDLQVSCANFLRSTRDGQEPRTALQYTAACQAILPWLLQSFTDPLDPEAGVDVLPSSPGPGREGSSSSDFGESGNGSQSHNTDCDCDGCREDQAIPECMCATCNGRADDSSGVGPEDNLDDSGWWLDSDLQEELEEEEDGTEPEEEEDYFDGYDPDVDSPTEDDEEVDSDGQYPDEQWPAEDQEDSPGPEP